MPVAATAEKSASRRRWRSARSWSATARSARGSPRCGPSCLRLGSSCRAAPMRSPITNSASSTCTTCSARCVACIRSPPAPAPTAWRCEQSTSVASTASTWLGSRSRTSTARAADEGEATSAPGAGRSSAAQGAASAEAAHNPHAPESLGAGVRGARGARLGLRRLQLAEDLECDDRPPLGGAELRMDASANAQLDLHAASSQPGAIESSRQESLERSRLRAEEGSERRRAEHLRAHHDRVVEDGQPGAAGDAEEQLAAARASRDLRLVERTDVNADVTRITEPAQVSSKEQAAHGSVRVVGQIIEAIARRSDQLRARSEPRRSCRLAEETSLEADVHIGDGVGILLEIRRGAGGLAVAQNAAPARDAERAREARVDSVPIIADRQGDPSEGLVLDDGQALRAVRRGDLKGPVRITERERHP